MKQQKCERRNKASASETDIELAIRIVGRKVGMNSNFILQISTYRYHPVPASLLAL